MNQQISRIISGSCTPASDLCDLVDAGAVTVAEANAVFAQIHAGLSIFDGAECEREYCKSHDI